MTSSTEHLRQRLAAAVRGLGEAPGSPVLADLDSDRAARLSQNLPALAVARTVRFVIGRRGGRPS
jgi:hypothetical protein